MIQVEPPEPASPVRVPWHELVVRLHPSDNVAIAKSRILPGTTLLTEPVDSHSSPITVRQPIPPAHKLALQEIARGQAVLRYGQLIGRALSDIHPGDHVHTHNLGLGSLSRLRTSATNQSPAFQARQVKPRTFLGYLRPDGQVATRNYIAVISTVTCSAHAAFPNVDGVIALTFHTGCTMQTGGETYTILQRTLAGMALHPNVAACLLVGLGCETNQASAMIRNYNLDVGSIEPPIVLSIQESGGVEPTIQTGIAAVTELLP
ncbi:MAG: altronate dehydratase, partial [Anaerolineae bacterium]|nr:altronate dehydratase [Anaerolineae bacterium]